MGKFHVILSPAFQRDLRKLTKELATRILQGMKVLEEDPFSRGDVKKVRSLKGAYRLRIGDHRVVFQVEGSRVIALRVMDRKELERVLRELA